jgi:hypothetical protein
MTGHIGRTLTRSYATSAVLGRCIGIDLGTDYGVSYIYTADGRLGPVGWTAAAVSDAATYTYETNAMLLQTLSYSSGAITTYLYDSYRDFKYIKSIHPD